MTLHYKKSQLNKALASYRVSGKIGFVPTMGALHQGHLSLVQRAIQDNDIVVVSIFVNPTQFDNALDLKLYPRTLEADVSLLSTLKEKIMVYAPDASDLYGHTVVAKKYNYGPIQYEMEGKHRKGHFDGVGTVVSALLKAVNPDHAYFGEKDFQQLQIIKKLVEIDTIDTHIIGCPIVREHNGLALSSRNKRLSPVHFEAATLLSKTLFDVKNKFKSHSISKLNTLVQKVFENNEYLQLEYFEIADEATLKTAHRKRKSNTYRAFIVVFAGDVRLIDNLKLN